MTPPVHSSTPSATRAFARQAVLILLPVVLLAGLAMTARQADRRQAEQRAREQARLAAQTLAVTVSEQVRTSLRHYEKTRENLFPPGPYSGLPLVFKTEWLGSPLIPPAPVPTNQTQEQWILPYLVWPRSASPIANLSYPTTPVPPGWWSALDPELRQRWETAGRLESAGAPRSEVIARYERCREVVSNYFFDANVLLALRRLSVAEAAPAQRTEALLSFSVGPKVLSPAGLPVAALTLFEILSDWSSGPLPPAVLRRLQDSVTVFPSVLTPVLLELAGRIEERETADPGREVARLRHLWAAQNRLRELAPSLREADVTNSVAYWIAEPPILVLQGVFPVINSRPEDPSRVTNEYLQAYLLPLAALAPMVQAAIEANRALVPAYASAGFRLFGKTMGDVPAAPGPEFIRYQSPTATPWELPFEVTLWLTNPEILYADQRQRERWTAAVILAAVLSAAVGVAQAWRTLRHQLALNEQQSNFVSAVSHELRAPLASVRLLAEGLANGQVSDEKQRRQYGAFLVEETRRLGALVENVLNFARIEQGRAQYEFIPTDARRLVRETVARFESIAAERRLQLRWHDETGNSSLEPNWDGLAVQQALANLLDNALKHGPETSEVVVTLRARESPPSTLEISVSDQGPGIPREDQVRIFERFYRRGSELRRETRGVGLGLALVKHIAEAHGGHVRVFSEPGHGATFTLELPLEPGIREQ